MTTVTFFRKGPAYLGFRAGGHSGHAPRGEDIVCAAISAAVGLAECGDHGCAEASGGSRGG